MTTNSGERTLRDRVGEQVYLNWRARMNPASETTWTELSPEDREWHRADADALLAAGVTAAESVPVADRERAVEVGAQAIHRWDKRPVTWERLDADTLEQYRSEAAVVVDALLAAGVFRSEPEIQDPVAGRDYMWDSSPVPAQDADDDEEYCPKCFAGMTAANHDECTDVRLVADRERVAEVLWHEIWADAKPFSEVSEAERSACLESADRVLLAAGVFRSLPTQDEIEDAVSRGWLDPNASQELIVYNVVSLLDGAASAVRSEAVSQPPASQKVEMVALDREAVEIAARAKIAEWYGTEWDASNDAFYETEDGGATGSEDTEAMLELRGVRLAIDEAAKLARPEAVVKAEALREAADAYAPGSHDWHKFRQWLRERADEMEGK